VNTGAGVEVDVITTCDPEGYGHVGLILLEDDGKHRCSICHEEADPGVDDGNVTIETRVTGKGALMPTLRPPCEHTGVTQQVFYAVTRNDAGVVIDRAAKVKLRCSSCGRPMRWVIPSAHFSEVDGERGLVCSVVAMTDTEAEDGWQAVAEE